MNEEGWITYTRMYITSREGLTSTRPFMNSYIMSKLSIDTVQ
jgi:hypothetical protein